MYTDLLQKVFNWENRIRT